MANVYSQVLVVVHGLATGAPVVPPAVPTGYIWVVRDIVAYNSGTFPGTCLGMQLYDGSDLVPMFTTPEFTSICQKVYHQEMRQVMATGHEFVARTFGPNWSIRVSGYALTTP